MFQLQFSHPNSLSRHLTGFRSPMSCMTACGSMWVQKLGPATGPQRQVSVIPAYHRECFSCLLYVFCHHFSKFPFFYQFLCQIIFDSWFDYQWPGVSPGGSWCFMTSPTPVCRLCFGKFGNHIATCVFLNSFDI